MALRLGLWFIVALMFFSQIGETTCGGGTSKASIDRSARNGASSKRLIGKSPHSGTIAKQPKGRSARNGTITKHSTRGSTRNGTTAKQQKIQAHKSWSMPMVRIEDYEKRRNPGLNKSNTQQWEEMVKRSRARLAYLNNRSNRTVSTETWNDRMEQGHGSATFLVDIEMGIREYQRVTRTFSVDTGSDFTWLQCSNCQECMNAPHEPYPAGQIAEFVECDDDMCLELGARRDCNPANADYCEFHLRYADGAEVYGTMAKDNINFNNDRNTVSTEIYVGMGNYVFVAQTEYDGILGLARSDLGLSYQLQPHFGKNVFSHCFVNPNTGYTSLFKMGSYPIPHTDVGYTPMVPGNVHYHVSLLAIKVGNEELRISPYVFQQVNGLRGTIVDSGSSFTYLPQVAYDAVTAAFRNQVQLPVIANPPLYSFCFDTSRSRTQITDLPDLIFEFEDDVTVDVEPADAFKSLDGDTKLCLAMDGVDNVNHFSIIGNIFMQNQWVIYDNDDNTIGFAGWHCDNV